MEGGEDLVGVGGRGRRRWRRVGVVGTCDAHLEVIVGWPEPMQRLVEDLGESLGDLDRPGPAAGVIALDRLQRQLAAIGDLLLGELPRSRATRNRDLPALPLGVLVPIIWSGPRCRPAGGASVVGLIVAAAILRHSTGLVGVVACRK